MYRLLYIDKLKALAMLLVVWGHTMYFCMYDEEKSNDPLMNIICTFHVPLFFFLSGFVISHAPDLPKFLSKARRFLVPMLVVGLVNALLIGNVRDFFLNGGHNGYWYLLTLTVFYLLLMLFRITEEKRGWMALCKDALLALLVWALSYFSMRADDVVVIAAINPYAFFAFWPFFIMGFLCRKYGLHHYITGRPWLTFLLLAAYIGLLAASFSNISHLPLNVVFTLAMLAIAALVALFHHFGENSTFLDRQLLLIGNSTLDIYLYHYFFIRFIELDFLRSRSLPVEAIVTAMLTIAITYGSIAIGRIVEMLILHHH